MPQGAVGVAGDGRMDVLAAQYPHLGSFGLGLGLTIANELVQKHGGRIQVGSGPDGGAMFTVVLPAASAA